MLNVQYTRAYVRINDDKRWTVANQIKITLLFILYHFGFGSTRFLGSCSYFRSDSFFFLLYSISTRALCQCGLWILARKYCACRNANKSNDRMEYNAAFSKWKSTTKGSPWNGINEKRKNERKISTKNNRPNKTNIESPSISIECVTLNESIFNAFDLCPYFVRTHCTHYIQHRIKIIFLFSFGIWTVKMALRYSCASAIQFHLFGLSGSLFFEPDRSIYLQLQWIKLNLLFLLWPIEFGFSLNFFAFFIGQDDWFVIPRIVCKQSVTKFA